MCVLIIPTAIMLASTFLLLRQMLKASQSSSLTFTSEQERNRKKRNRSITIMLIGESHKGASIKYVRTEGEGGGGRKAYVVSEVA